MITLVAYPRLQRVIAFLRQGAGTANGDNGEADPWMQNPERLAHARFDGPGVVLAYMADDANYVSRSTGSTQLGASCRERHVC